MNVSIDEVRSEIYGLVIVISEVEVFAVSWVKMKVAVGAYDLGSSRIISTSSSAYTETSIPRRVGAIDAGADVSVVHTHPTILEMKLGRRVCRADANVTICLERSLGGTVVGVDVKIVVALRSYPATSSTTINKG